MHNVVVGGPEEDIVKMKEFIKNGKEAIDFEKIIPMPKELNITAGCYQYETQSKWGFNFRKDTFYFEQKSILDKTDKYLDLSQEDYVDKILLTREYYELIHLHNMKRETLEDMKRNEEGVINILKGYWNYKKFGSVNWYDWSTEHWGTKWNVVNTEWYGDTLVFSTAWSTCQPIFEKLSELFPTLSFDITYCDEDMYGGNSGCYSYEGGDFYENDKDLHDIIAETWGENCIEDDDDEDEEEETSNDNSSDAEYEGGNNELDNAKA